MSEINYKKIEDLVKQIEPQLKCCPFCGKKPKLINNLDSWTDGETFVIKCSNQDCFMSEEEGLGSYFAQDQLEYEREVNPDTTTGCIKILRKMKKIWNHRVSSRRSLNND